MLWVTKGNISAVYRQSECAFMLVITIRAEVYLWFALLLSSCLRKQFLELSCGGMLLNYLPCQIGQEKILEHKFVS